MPDLFFTKEIKDKRESPSDDEDDVEEDKDGENKQDWDN
jgi:hypothetical protein